MSFEWKPIATMVTQPQKDQRVFYFFAPSGHWFIGAWDGGCTFYSRHGFCDWHDAPFWHPEPPAPEGLEEDE